MVELEQIGAPAFTLRVCPDGKFRYLAVNAAYSARTGMVHDDVVGRTPHNIHDPLTAAWLCEFYQDAVRGRCPVEYDMRVTLMLGDLWWRTTLMPIVSAGVVESLLGICQDVTAEKRLEADLLASNQQLDMAIRMLKGATWQFDAHANRFEVSPNIAMLLGEDQPRDVTWEEWSERILVEDRDLASCDRLLAAGMGEQTVEFRFRDRGGNIRWARCQRMMAAGMADTTVVSGVVIDITAERQRTAALEIEATRDSLTGLLNHRGLKRALPSPLPPGTAVVMVDVDGFKGINDKHGHARGDAVLIDVATRLAEAVGPGAHVARLGGDEFLAVWRAADADAARGMRREIVEALTFSHEDGGKRVPVAASVGCAWSDGGQVASDLMAEADDELYRTKRARKASARAAFKASEDGERDRPARVAA